MIDESDGASVAVHFSPNSSGAPATVTKVMWLIRALAARRPKEETSLRGGRVEARPPTPKRVD